MANTKLLIKLHPKKLVFIAALALAAAIFWLAPKASAAACTAPATNMGTVTSSTSVTTAGTYRIWSRIMSGTASTDNSYDLEIDGTTCYHVGNSSSMPTGTWQWVDYQNGTTSSKIDVALSAGTHTIKMIGTEDGVKVDRIIMTTDTACVPTGTGDNCVSTADTTSPTTSITSPTAGAKLRGTVTVNATATDDSNTINRVEFLVDGVVVGAADTTAPYSFSWNTANYPGTRTLTVRAYDPSNNMGTSASVSVTVDNTPPTVSITAPLNNAPVTGTVNITANASDGTGTGVASVNFYRNGSTLIASDTTSPYSASWNTTSLTDGTYPITAVATDAAGNTTTSSIVNLNVDNVVDPVPDTTKPTTSITSPTNGSPVTGTVAVAASAQDNVGVTKVELWVDGALAGTDVAAPYSFSLDTSGLSGSHSLYTKAYDAAGNVGQSATITVTVTTTSTNPGDVNGDGHVTIIDLSILLTNYGSSSATRSQGDLDANGAVNILDLSRLLTYFGS